MLVLSLTSRTGTPPAPDFAHESRTAPPLAPSFRPPQRRRSHLCPADSCRRPRFWIAPLLAPVSRRQQRRRSRLCPATDSALPLAFLSRRLAPSPPPRLAYALLSCALLSFTSPAKLSQAQTRHKSSRV
ncbi:hypothetical protein B0H13DRAFT_2329036 [Mycena leptocephala]|nr:hypothetical protein B0H13DRAFT_2329036 [Mycena leptocephala]